MSDDKDAVKGTIRSDGKSSGKELEKVDEEAERVKRGWMRWAFGWIVVPGLILGSIWLGGLLLGAHMSESWFTRAILWIVGLFQ